MLSLFIATWGSVNLILSLISIKKIKQNKNEVNFIWWWAFPSGSFCWEDMLVFGTLHAGLALFSLIIGNTTFWVVTFLIFWIIRSAGEALYQFLEQFIVPKHHPHNIGLYLSPLRKFFGNISDQKCFILLQVFMQTILVLSILCLFYILRYVPF